MAQSVSQYSAYKGDLSLITRIHILKTNSLDGTYVIAMLGKQLASLVYLVIFLSWPA